MNELINMPVDVLETLDKGRDAVCTWWHHFRNIC